MEKKETKQLLYKGGLVAVIRGENKEDALAKAEACIAGGLSIVEITFTVPEADEVIRTLASRGYTVGAGSVLDAATAARAAEAGAAFIVSPICSREISEECAARGVLGVSGAFTPTEIVEAKRGGADIVKLFPAGVYGPSGLKTIRGPLPDVDILPTGGVSLDNLAAWFAAGAFALGVGSALTEGKEYSRITRDAAAYRHESDRALAGRRQWAK